MTHAPLDTLCAAAQYTPDVKTGVLVVGPTDVAEPALPEASVPVQDREQVRKLVHSLAAAALLACTVCAASAAAAVAVTPLSEEVFTAPINNVTLPAEKRPDGWQTGPLIPLEEWKRYCNRPNALGPHPQGRGAVAEVYPNGATGYVRDPAYLPVLPLEQPKATTRKSKKTAATPYGPAAASPTMPSVAAPRVPTVAAPTVAAPTVAGPASVPGVTVPAVPGTTAPAVAGTASPTRPTSPATGPVAAPYSATAPATGPVTPAASPSLAAQSPAQDGIMATGRGIASDMAAQAGQSARSNGAAGTAATGTQLNMGERRPFIGGQANTLVVPPEGISLQPNNGSAALTAPANPQ